MVDIVRFGFGVVIQIDDLAHDLDPADLTVEYSPPATVAEEGNAPVDLSGLLGRQGIGHPEVQTMATSQNCPHHLRVSGGHAALSGGRTEAGWQATVRV